MGWWLTSSPDYLQGGTQKTLTWIHKNKKGVSMSCILQLPNCWQKSTDISCKTKNYISISILCQEIVPWGQQFQRENLFPCTTVLPWCSFLFFSFLYMLWWIVFFTWSLYNFKITATNSINDWNIIPHHFRHWQGGFCWCICHWPSFLQKLLSSSNQLSVDIQLCITSTTSFHSPLSYFNPKRCIWINYWNSSLGKRL